MILALTLAGSASLAIAGPQEPAPPPPTVSDAGETDHYRFEVREVRADGFGWRQAIYGKARRLDWQAGVTVWAVDDAAVGDLLVRWQGSPRTEVVQAPLARAAAGEAALTMTGSPVHLLIDMDRVADGAPGEAAAVAFQPVVEEMRNGMDLAVSATPGAEGLTLGVNLDETRIQDLYTTSIEDGVRHPDGGNRPKLLQRLGLRDEDVDRASTDKVQTTYQVPEIVRSHLEGTYALKRGESLLVSLGARSAEERWGKGVVFERLVLIQARPDGPDAAPAPPPPYPPGGPPLPSVDPLSRPVVPGASPPRE